MVVDQRVWVLSPQVPKNLGQRQGPAVEQKLGLSKGWGRAGGQVEEGGGRGWGHPGAETGVGGGPGACGAGVRTGAEAGTGLRLEVKKQDQGTPGRTGQQAGRMPTAPALGSVAPLGRCQTWAPLKGPLFFFSLRLHSARVGIPGVGGGREGLGRACPPDSAFPAQRQLPSPPLTPPQPGHPPQLDLRGPGRHRRPDTLLLAALPENPVLGSRPPH